MYISYKIMFMKLSFGLDKTFLLIILLFKLDCFAFNEDTVSLESLENAVLLGAKRVNFACKTK